MIIVTIVSNNYQFLQINMIYMCYYDIYIYVLKNTNNKIVSVLLMILLF